MPENMPKPSMLPAPNPALSNLGKIVLIYFDWHMGINFFIIVGNVFQVHS